MIIVMVLLLNASCIIQDVKSQPVDWCDLLFSFPDGLSPGSLSLLWLELHSHLQKDFSLSTGSSFITILTPATFSNQTLCVFSSWNTDVIFSLLVWLLKYYLNIHVTHSTFNNLIHNWYWKPTNYLRSKKLKCV